MYAHFAQTLYELAGGLVLASLGANQSRRVAFRDHAVAHDCSKAFQEGRERNCGHLEHAFGSREKLAAKRAGVFGDAAEEAVT